MYLQSTFHLDSDHPEVKAYVTEFAGIADETERAIAIYKKVRDGFLYDPYHLDLRKSSLRASGILSKKRAWCVEKAIVCTAAFRAAGIPSRLGFGIVTNHIGVEKLKHYLRRDEIVFHGFSEAFLKGKWVKCTPAFDVRICRLNGVDPLDWNGKEDSLLHPYKGTEKYMEYLHFYGSFDDVPVDLMNAEMAKYYPHLVGAEATRDFSVLFESSVSVS